MVHPESFGMITRFYSISLHFHRRPGIRSIAITLLVRLPETLQRLHLIVHSFVESSFLVLRSLLCRKRLLPRHLRLAWGRLALAIALVSRREAFGGDTINSTGVGCAAEGWLGY